MLQRWAKARDLSLQWYVGHQVAIVAGEPARLGAALGVRIDDYRSPDGQVFYSATVHRRAPPRSPARCKTSDGSATTRITTTIMCLRGPHPSGPGAGL